MAANILYQTFYNSWRKLGFGLSFKYSSNTQCDDFEGSSEPIFVIWVLNQQGNGNILDTST